MAKLVQFDFQVVGEKQFQRAFRGVEDSVNDFTGAFEGIVKDFHATEKEQFDAEGSFEGNKKWHPLSEDYAKWKAKHASGKTILRLHDHLYTSLTSRGTGSIVKIGKLSMEVGTEIFYAIIHQMKPVSHKKKIVGTPREPIRLTEEQKKRWVKIIRKSLKDKINISAAQSRGVY